MKAKPRAIRDLVLAAKAAGKSFEVVAAEFDVPLGTVKTWWSRYRGKLTVVGGRLPLLAVVSGNHGQPSPTTANHGQLRARGDGDETPATVGKKGGDETYRGLQACHMPGRRGNKQMTFSLFKRGMWPPKTWKVPAGLVGGELLMLLQERSCMGLEGKKRK